MSSYPWIEASISVARTHRRRSGSTAEYRCGPAIPSLTSPWTPSWICAIWARSFSASDRVPKAMRFTERSVRPRRPSVSLRKSLWSTTPCATRGCAICNKTDAGPNIRPLQYRLIRHISESGEKRYGCFPTPAPVAAALSAQTRSVLLKDMGIRQPGAARGIGRPAEPQPTGESPAAGAVRRRGAPRLEEAQPDAISDARYERYDRPVVVASSTARRECIPVSTDSPPTRQPLVALLGPTNTGKTHRAVERLLEHRTGMIGLPLRLLAREVYDKLSVRAGEQAVALVTGEEKRVPALPRYWVCTRRGDAARSQGRLPRDRRDPARRPTTSAGTCSPIGCCTPRGRLETWFLGSNTLRPMVAELVPTTAVRSHTRLSTLRHKGRLKVSALPPRTAIVAFSMARVYELAERVRARRGGAAVVLGALSPRARNAQVALYQSGEVDYLVATDAIGMGLNLDVDHVAFAELTKFDGRVSRNLEPVELAQIAGRAGRHLNDGTFGTLAPVDTLTPPVVAAIEGHRLPPVRRVMWRNRDLDFATVDDLLGSLQQRPSQRSLRLSARAADSDALRRLALDPLIRDRAGTESGVRLLWDVCQIPDYRQLCARGSRGAPGRRIPPAHRAERPAVRRLDGRLHRPPRSDQRRYRRPPDAPRVHPHLDVYRPPFVLGGRPRSLASTHPRHRGSTKRRSARAAGGSVRRPATHVPSCATHPGRR